MVFTILLRRMVGFHVGHTSEKNTYISSYINIDKYDISIYYYYTNFQNLNFTTPTTH